MTHDPLARALHLSYDRLLDGACFVEPPAYDRPCLMDYHMGQIGRIQSRGYRVTLQSVRGYDTEVAKGWITEDADFESAVHALIMQSGRGA